MMPELLPSVKRAGVALLFTIWGSLLIGFIIADYRVLGELVFYMAVPVLFGAVLAPVSIVTFWSNFFYFKKDWVPGAFIWLVIPVLILMIVMVSVSNWHGFRERDWIPIFIITPVGSLVTYAKYLRGKRWMSQ